MLAECNEALLSKVFGLNTSVNICVLSINLIIMMGLIIKIYAGATTTANIHSIAPAYYTNTSTVALTSMFIASTMYILLIVILIKTNSDGNTINFCPSFTNNPQTNRKIRGAQNNLDIAKIEESWAQNNLDIAEQRVQDALNDIVASNTNIKPEQRVQGAQNNLDIESDGKIRDVLAEEVIKSE
ncbi:unnamed protein product [Schistosoma turkestanicum]|nr:unnamed protein product [Schistosoma turkestanicum]